MFKVLFLVVWFISLAHAIFDDYDLLESVTRKVRAKDLPALSCVNGACRDMVVATKEGETVHWLQKVAVKKSEASSVQLKDFFDSLILYPQLYGHFIRASRLRRLLDFMPYPIIDGEHFLTSRITFNRDGSAVKKRLELYRYDLKYEDGTVVLSRISTLKNLGPSFEKECHSFLQWFPRALENPRAYMNLRTSYPKIYEIYREVRGDFHKLC